MENAIGLKSLHRDSGRRTQLMKSRVSAAFGDASDNPTGIFPRIIVKDPYQRLGISSEASEVEIQAARKYLINMCGSHQPSVDAIKSAHDKIIMQSFYDRKNPKIDIKKVNAVTQSRAVKAIVCRFQTRATNFIIWLQFSLFLECLLCYFPPKKDPLDKWPCLLLRLYTSYMPVSSVKCMHSYMELLLFWDHGHWALY